MTGALGASLVCLATLACAGPAAAHTPRVGRLIVGGQTAASGTFPSLAYVTEQLPDGNAELCSGTVLSSNVVLTAGHCAENLTTGAVDAAAGFIVITGSTDWTNTTRRQVSSVSRVIVHPGFDAATFDGGDAALLVLSTPTTAPAVRLATGADAALWQPGSSVAIAGWGKTDPFNPASVPAQLQWGTTVTQSTDYCTQQAAQGGVTFDAADELCVIDNPSFQVGTCAGDSGGPLLASPGTGTPVEVGIDNFGPADCDPQLPQFFTRADAISAWAMTEVSAFVPPSHPPPAPAPPSLAPPESAHRPVAGIYSGGTSQGRSTRLRVVSSRKRISVLKVGFTLRCSRRRPMSTTISTRPVTLKGLRFSLKLVRHGNEHLAVTGRFTTGGSVKGTLRVTSRTRADGSCRSGPVWWSGRTRPRSS